MKTSSLVYTFTLKKGAAISVYSDAMLKWITFNYEVERFYDEFNDIEDMMIYI